MSARILVEVGAGELIDKLTILRIKTRRITEADKLANVEHELGVLTAARARAIEETPELSALEAALERVNEHLWNIEDEIRRCEAASDFGERFVELARAVYATNDHRAALKKEINLLTGSAVIEEKSYAGSG